MEGKNFPYAKSTKVLLGSALRA